MPPLQPDNRTIFGGRIPLDAILLFIAGVGTSRLIGNGFLNPMIQGNGRVLIIDVAYFVGFLILVILSQSQVNRNRWRFIVSTVVSLFVIFYVLGIQLVSRPLHASPPPIQDGAVQTEEAARFLIHGTNPYSADFRPTRFGVFPSPYSADVPNVAWTHYVYPPLNAVLAIPIVWLQDRHWSVDVSIEYTLAFVVMALALAWIQPTWERRSLIATLFLANPFLWLLPVAGLNDALMLLCLVLAAIWLSRRRWTAAGIAFGLAIAAKQYAWVAAPLWLWWAYVHYRRGTLHGHDVRRLLVSAGITMAVFYLPFLLANYAALYDDLVRYLSGAIPHSYPIAGSTLVQYLRVWGIISSPWAAVPTTLFQLAVGIPLFWWSGRLIWRRPALSTVLMGGVVVTLGMFLVSRFFLINYSMTLACLMIAAFALEGVETPGAPRTPTHR